MIYLDNPATSFPKPSCVTEAMVHFMNDIGANPGRAGHHRANESGRCIFSARESVAALFSCDDSLRVVFTGNATESLNYIIAGFLEPGDHVITSSIEHNSVMRPLRAREKEGIVISTVSCDRQGFLSPIALENEIRPSTKLIILNHASNVTGSLQPLAEIGTIVRKHDLYFCVDAAQSAGAIPIHMERDAIDFLVFTGHKALYGPMGTGGLVFGKRVDVDSVRPFITGGTGSKSEYEQQPCFLPDKFESGTPNTVGIAGLGAGVDYILSRGVESIRKREMELCEQLIGGLSALHNVTVYGGLDPERQTATVSFSIDDISCSDAGFRLDEVFGICCRVGLHCAPSAHKTIGTFPQGTIRFGASYFTTMEEIEIAIDAVKALTQCR
ncbi:MAG: aminotransferase class V-fold PLP-dependent enzyme [Chitinivibrionales bacterium]|nr:aminotransferase class V-fold PLP-dependent enzyme [Chitinivibrionales bacterium]